MSDPASMPAQPAAVCGLAPVPGQGQGELLHPLVEARDLHKAYAIGKRSLEVLRGVTLSLERAGILALRGASGAGKSTLLHLLGGLDTPNQGQILMNGCDLAGLAGSALAELRIKKIGFVFQAYHLLPELDALENVCLPARIARVPSHQAEARGRRLLDRVGLGHRVDHKPAELSGGEQQRVAIARALIIATHDARVAARAPRIVDLVDGRINHD